MRKTSIILPVFFALLLLFLICGVSDYSAGVLPEAAQYRSVDGSILFDNVEKLDFKGVKISAQCVSPGMAENPVNDEGAPVNIVAADEYCPLLQSIKMVSGSFWSNTSEASSFVAVLDERLAVKLFKSTDIIGQEVIINGSKLTITGVRKHDKSFVSQISLNGLDAVYIPYNANVQDVPKAARDIYIQQIKNDTVRAPDSSTYHAIDQALSGALGEYAETDYFAQSRILSQMRSIAFFILGLAVIMFFIRTAVRVLVGMLRRFNEAKDTFGQDIRKQIKPGVIAGLLIAVSVAVFLLVSFELFVPGTAIPSDDNVLNFGFYYDAIIKSLQARNVSPPDYYGNVVFYAFWILTLLIAVFAGIVISLFSRIAKISPNLTKM